MSRTPVVPPFTSSRSNVMTIVIDVANIVMLIFNSTGGGYYKVSVSSIRWKLVMGSLSAKTYGRKMVVILSFLASCIPTGGTLSSMHSAAYLALSLTTGFAFTIVAGNSTLTE